MLGSCEESNCGESGMPDETVCVWVNVAGEEEEFSDVTGICNEEEEAEMDDWVGEELKEEDDCNDIASAFDEVDDEGNVGNGCWVIDEEKGKNDSALDRWAGRDDLRWREIEEERDWLKLVFIAGE